MNSFSLSDKKTNSTSCILCTMGPKLLFNHLYTDDIMQYFPKKVEIFLNTVNIHCIESQILSQIAYKSIKTIQQQFHEKLNLKSQIPNVSIRFFKRIYIHRILKSFGQILNTAILDYKTYSFVHPNLDS